MSFMYDLLMLTKMQTIDKIIIITESYAEEGEMN